MGFGGRGMMDMLGKRDSGLSLNDLNCRADDGTFCLIGQGGEMVNGVQNSVQGVMHTVARVSGLLEELMRNFTMIFESIFGLFYSIAAFKEVRYQDEEKQQCWRKTSKFPLCVDATGNGRLAATV